MAPPITIVCLGDSITGASDLARYLKWSHILAAMAAAACGPDRVVVHNRGIGGDTSAGMAARLDRDVLALHPDVVVLLAGGNDAGQQVARADTAANLAAIAGRISASGARLLGLQYHLVVHPGREAEAWRHLPANNDLLAAAVREVGGELAATDVAMAAAARTGPPAELTGPDGVHLSPGGELVYARTVFAALQRLGWLPADPPA